MLWSLPLLPLATGLAALFLGQSARRTLAGVSLAALALTLLLAIAAAALGWSGELAWSRHLALSATLTPAAATMATLVPAIALPILAYATAHEDRRGLARLIGLMLVFVGGMELLVVASDFLTLLIGWEIVGACSWALIAHRWREADNPRSGLYAFLVTRFGDLGMFVAAMTVFAGAGSLSYDALDSLASPWLEIAAFGLIVSAAAKSGQVPFAPWLFRAMAGPTSVSALLHAAAMVAAGAWLLIRLEPHLAHAAGFSDTVLVVGLLTALAGGLVALLQNHAKKLLAASTSAHYGLMFVAVGAGHPGIALLHLVVHAAFKALLFLAAGVAGERAGSFALERMGFGKALPLVTAASAVGALALAGVPPLGGGWTKEAIVSAAGSASGTAAFGVMIAGALSAAYAARFQLLAFARADDPPEGEPPGRNEYAAVTAFAVLSLLLSVLWLPAVHDLAAAHLGARIPASKLPELVMSLLLVAFGLIAGRYLAERDPALGTAPPVAAFANWLGLPVLVRPGIARPFERTAAIAAGLDDRVLDAVPRGAGRAAAAVSRSFSRLDDRALDAVPRAAGRLATTLARSFAGQDRRAVDRGVELAAAFAQWLARIGGGIGERGLDGLPEGSARLIGLSGRDARRIQTGLSHHYYALMAAGALVIAAILLVGA